MHRSGAALAAVLLTFALTSTAAAATYCVAPATGCEHTATSLNDALQQAALQPGDDTISLGAGAYQENLASYAPADHARVSITGAGQDATTIRRQNSSNGDVTLRALGGPLDLAALTVMTGDSTNNMAVQLQSGGDLDHVQVLSAPGASHPIGMETLAESHITGSRFAVDGDQKCLSLGGAVTSTVADTSVSGCASGIGSTANRLIAGRLRITDVVDGFTVLSGTANLDDSLITHASDAGAYVDVTGAAGATLYASQNTLIGPGAYGAVAYNHGGSGTARAEVYDSIIRGYTKPFA